jgi:eukaryotic-like serine/threonine-protein kinase
VSTQLPNREKIKALFHEAFELDSAARGRFLRDKCPDAEVRAEVERLLAEHDEARDFLSRPALGDFPVEAKASSSGSDEPTASIDSGEIEVKIIDRYYLLEKIGEGGMGEVWRAEQKEPIRRRVALKLIKSGTNTREVMARFESERQALALMDHPAIAKIFDAGSTPQGAPYFVMEYIAGVPITAYCDNHKLSVRERLELFKHVCEGVQHAHQKAIIHRDLKPSNILVTEVDGRAVPKIIDFGVAKALSQKMTADTIFTRAGALIGTPEYMSPEQASSGGEDIDTRTDVYSLGIVFYELLAGVPPIQLRRVAFEEFLRRLREDEPAKPSTKIRTQDQATSTDVARKRQSEPLTLYKQMRGELDSVALKALEKDRSRRYGSPSDFAADVARYLNNDAVLAVPPSAAYRARKFARRYRTGLVIACAFALVLIAAAVISTRQSIRANREAIRASREAAIAEAVNNFLQNDLLAQASAAKQSGPSTKPDLHIEVRTVLDRAAERIEGKFTNQPVLEASIRDSIGRTYIDLGLYPEARKQLERELELRRMAQGPEDINTLKSMAYLGYLCVFEGKYAEAEILEKQALEVQSRVLGAEHRDTLESMDHLAVTYALEQKYQLAEDIQTRALGIRKRLLGPEDPQTLSSMYELANVYLHEGKSAQAEALDAQTVEIQKRVLGSEHPATLRSMTDLAADYASEGKYAQAEALNLQTLEIRKRVLGPEHYDTLISMINLAFDYRGEDKNAQAEAFDIQALEIQKRVLGPNHPETLRTMNNLADDYINEGKYAQLEAILVQILEIQKRVLGPENSHTATTLYNLGCMAARRGDKEKAIALLSQAVDHGLSPREDLAMGQDTDLTSLHSDPRFAALMTHAKQKAEAKQ